jgi:hypothetical protein
VALFVKLFSRVWSTRGASSNCLVRSSMPGLCSQVPIAVLLRFRRQAAALPASKRSASAVSPAYAAYLSQTRTPDRRRDRGLPEGRFAVLGIIGMDASPTCGVTKSLAKEQALVRIARLSIARGRLVNNRRPTTA